MMFYKIDRVLHQILKTKSPHWICIWMSLLLNSSFFPNLDVVEFWKNNKKRCLALSTMACDILSIPITTVASESTFRIGGRVLNKFRTRLLRYHVEAIICTRNWLQGFLEDYEDLEDDAFSNKGSNVVEDNDA